MSGACLVTQRLTKIYNIIRNQVAQHEGNLYVPFAIGIADTSRK